ncbi:MAG TPA: TRAFs-binding domain-containing protein [Pyrinomonadaceae bacterium]|nr:TRAFs-binding domain-containing protein [Pyrinomonadaceae bacterium]
MSEKQAEALTGTCYVVMGFGKKTDFETGRTLDLDKSYRIIIKPAVKAAGLKCVRADEIVHSGLIDVPMYEQLLKADVVIADLSTSNRDAYYQLGVRHALKPHTTIVICEDAVKYFPFGLDRVTVRQYHHMGEGIDAEEVERFRAVLTDAIVEMYGRRPQQDDSPVYAFLKDLAPPSLPGAADGAPGDGAVADAGGRPTVAETNAKLMQEAEAALKEGNFDEARSFFRVIRMTARREYPDAPEDPYFIQRLALATYKSKRPSVVEALQEARGLLETLSPKTSNDTETLGLWGAVNKRLWEETREGAHLDEAVRAYDRGFHVREDYYNGVNLAFLLNVRAAAAPTRMRETRTPAEGVSVRAEAVADFVEAERVRREVLSICEAVLKDKLPDSDRYWVLATMAEVYVGVGDEENARQMLEVASASASASWMKESTAEQLNKLRALLADSPLKYVEAAAA